MGHIIKIENNEEKDPIKMSQFIFTVKFYNQKNRYQQTAPKNYYIKYLGQGKYEVRHNILRLPSFRISKKSYYEKRVLKFDGFIKLAKYLVSKVISKTMKYRPVGNIDIETVVNIHSSTKDDGFLDRYRDILFNELHEEVAKYNNSYVLFRKRVEYKITKMYKHNPQGSVIMNY